MKQPLVSVITITRNRGKLLKRSISSVLNQTYRNIEYIIVDGASTDSTDSVVTSFEDKRVIYIKLKENKSIIDSINLAFDKASGDYVTFLDSDDEYVLTKIEKQVKLFSSLSEEYGMVYCWMTYFDDKNHKFLRLHNPQLRGFIGSDVVEKPIVSGTPTYLFRYDVFKELGGWNKDIGIISDWELAVRCCQNWKVDYVPESLVNVYINHGSDRMSDKKYYKDLNQRIIIFHEYFLSEFKMIFSKNQEKKQYHLRFLVNSCFQIGDFNKAFKYYCQLLFIRFSLRNVLVFPKSIVKYIIK